MIKTKLNKFYIGKQEVTLFAVYLPDLLTDKPQDYYFHFNPKTKKFEMQKDKTFAYTASQVYFDSTFIIIAQHKKSERMDLVNDKTFLFEFFDEPMYEDEKELFLEHGKEEMDKINSSLPEYWQRYRNIELAKRKKEEAMLVSKGYKIDEGYQDPDLLPSLNKINLFLNI